jgi:flagellar protein FliS
MLPAVSGADVYRRLHVESRTPLELVVMLYDGALGRIKDARSALERGDIVAFRDAIGFALAIVAELQNTLDLRAGGDIARSLDGLYTFVTTALLEASARRSSRPLDGVDETLSILRDAWGEIGSRTAGAAP